MDDDAIMAKVNRLYLPIVVRECHDIDTCNGGECRHGDLLFDGEFTCNCTAIRRTGSYCLTPVVSAGALADSGTEIAIATSLGVMALILITVLAVRR